jgi:Predicted permease, DMT superfamily
MVVAIAWGSTYWIAKELITEDTVLAFLAARMCLTALFLSLIVLGLPRRPWKRDVLTGIILGLLLSTVFFFETFGIAGTSATNAGVIISLTIIFTPLLETLVGRRRLSGLFYIAATLAVGGVYFLGTGGSLGAFTLGDVLILVAAIARALHVTFMHRLTAGHSADSLQLTFVQMATCGAVFLALSTFWGSSTAEYLATLSASSWLQLLYLVVICTVFPFFIQMWAVRKTSPTRVSLLVGTEPVWAAVIGVTLAGDRLGPTGILGIVLVLAGTLWGQQIEGRRRIVRSVTPSNPAAGDPVTGELGAPDPSPLN